MAGLVARVGAARPLVRRGRENMEVLPTLCSPTTCSWLARALVVWEPASSKLSNNSARPGTPLLPSYCLPITNHQIERTEEFYRRLRGDAQKNRWRVTRTWIGPFIAIVTINHPETLKAILKGCHLILPSLLSATTDHDLFLSRSTAPKDPNVYSLFESWLGDCSDLSYMYL